MTRPPAIRSDTDAQPDSDGPGFEAAIEEIESIIDRIESGSIGLEESIEAYERGAGLIARCRSILGRAQSRVEDLTLELQRGDDSPPSTGRADESGASHDASE